MKTPSSLVAGAQVLLLARLLGAVEGYLEMSLTLGMLNIPWEGKCPVTPLLRLHPQLSQLGYVGRCPTVYQVTELSPGSVPRAVLEGFCDPSCHNSVCGSFGDFRCRNHTVPVVVTDGDVARVIRTAYISVGCVCQYRRSTKLARHELKYVV